jgi:hypothetical protein
VLERGSPGSLAQARVARCREERRDDEDCQRLSRPRPLCSRGRDRNHGSDCPIVLTIGLAQRLQPCEETETLLPRLGILAEQLPNGVATLGKLSLMRPSYPDLSMVRACKTGMVELRYEVRGHRGA